MYFLKCVNKYIHSNFKEAAKPQDRASQNHFASVTTLRIMFWLIYSGNICFSAGILVTQNRCSEQCWNTVYPSFAVESNAVTHLN